MPGQKGSIRSAYYQLVQRPQESIEPVLPSVLLDRQLPRCEGSEELWTAIRELGLREEAEQPALPADSQPTVLIAYAPTALLDGCWLLRSVQVDRTDTLLGQILLDAFYLETGSGSATQHHGNLYRAALAAQGIAVASPQSDALCQDDRLTEEDFALALLGLRIGRASPSALPEVLGMHAAMTLWGPPLRVRSALAEQVQSQYLAVHQRDQKEQRCAEQLAKRSLLAYAALGTPAWDRLYAAAAALHHQRRKWLASLRPKRKQTAWQAMMTLVESKCRHGFGFHRNVQLQGRSLDAWFDPSKPNLAGFLATLARSPWVVPGHPEHSPLLQRTTQFGGSMFGVFDDAELAVLHDWIAALPDSATAPPSELSASEPASSALHDVSILLTQNPKEAAIQSQLPSLPIIYHRLLTAPHRADSASLAHQYLTQRLHAVESAARVEVLHRQGLWPWSAQRLTDWVDARLREQVAAGTAIDSELLGIERHLRRDQVLWLLCQLTPAALIDGAWLQGVASPDCSCAESASLLFRIYRDELGAGIPHQHHGNIMRAVLAEQGVVLPSCDTLDFACWPGFLPDSFATPVQWLAISYHSREFYPELLGLNLAVELAGVGQMYSRASALLRHHHIDPYFFVLHNTIDNGASGHTAWSVRAIKLYLEELAQCADPALVARAWQRIWLGYAAHDRASTPMLRAISLRLFPSLGLRWLRAKTLGIPAVEVS